MWYTKSCPHGLANHSAWIIPETTEGCEGALSGIRSIAVRVPTRAGAHRTVVRWVKKRSNNIRLKYEFWITVEYILRYIFLYTQHIHTEVDNRKKKEKTPVWICHSRTSNTCCFRYYYYLTGPRNYSGTTSRVRVITHNVILKRLGWIKARKKW